MAVLPRDVVLIWDRHTHPSKPKLHICVCQVRRWFLRINTRPIFRPNHPLPKRGNSFLDHDSYIELQQLVTHGVDAVDEAECIGRLSDESVAALCDAIRDAKTLSEDHKDFIIRRLTEDESPV